MFCNHKPRAEWLAAQLSAAGYPAAFLSGDRAQAERMKAMEDVRGFKLRVGCGRAAGERLYLAVLLLHWWSGVPCSRVKVALRTPALEVSKAVLGRLLLMTLVCLLCPVGGCVH